MNCCLSIVNYYANTQFIYEVARKMHPIIKTAIERMRDVYVHNLSVGTPADVVTKINDVFKVSSTCNVWLR